MRPFSQIPTGRKLSSLHQVKKTVTVLEAVRLLLIGKALHGTIQPKHREQDSKITKQIQPTSTSGWISGGYTRMGETIDATACFVEPGKDGSYNTNIKIRKCEQIFLD